MRLLIKLTLVVALLVGMVRAAHADWMDLFNLGGRLPFTLVPVPEIATDPNQGTTIGVLPVMLFSDDQKQIRNIIAPDVAYNTILGATGHLRYLAYPSADTQYYAIAGASTNIARNVDLSYSTGRERKSRFSFDARLFYERDPTERFFGLGNDSPFGHETNYTTEQLYFEGRLGLNLSEALQIALVTRPRYVRIHKGALNSLPYTANVFPLLQGINGGSEFLNRIEVSYDTRDSVDIPRHGGQIRVFYGFADRAFGSTASYNEAGFDVRHYIPLSKRITLAGHLYAEYMPAGNETPFWAMPRLGGEESFLANQETLRGYGAGRFIDNNLFVGNIEARTKVYEADLFDTHGILELAPFLEAGKVSHQADQDPVTRLHPVGGMGFRAIAAPFVVGYVDVGWGGEGAAFFSGINYPF